MNILLWLKGSKLARWSGFAILAAGLLKLLEAMGARRGKAELKAEQNEQRLKESQLAKQDLYNAENQTDADLVGRLTRGE